MNKVLIFIILASSSVSQAQISFETNFSYSFDWGDNSYHEYSTDIENQKVNNFNYLIKNDNRFIEDTENVILNFLIANLNAGNLTGLQHGKDTLSAKEIQKILYWKADISTETGDSIRWHDREKFVNIKIHQKWLLDTIKNTLNNYVLGLTLLKYDNEVDNELFYIPFTNEPKKISINDEEIVYIREIKNMFPWNEFKKDAIAKILTNHSGEFYHQSEGINKFNRDNYSIKNLDTLFDEINILGKDLHSSVLNFSKGVYINQSLYIDYKNMSINTSINAISPLFPVGDNKDYNDKYNGGMMYFLPLYWLNFRKID